MVLNIISILIVISLLWYFKKRTGRIIQQYEVNPVQVEVERPPIPAPRVRSLPVAEVVEVRVKKRKKERDIPDIMSSVASERAVVGEMEDVYDHLDHTLQEENVYITMDKAGGK